MGLTGCGKFTYGLLILTAPAGIAAPWMWLITFVHNLKRKQIRGKSFGENGQGNVGGVKEALHADPPITTVTIDGGFCRRSGLTQLGLLKKLRFERLRPCPVFVFSTLKAVSAIKPRRSKRSETTPNIREGTRSFCAPEAVSQRSLGSPQRRKGTATFSGWGNACRSSNLLVVPAAFKPPLIAAIFLSGSKPGISAPPHPFTRRPLRALGIPAKKEPRPKR